MTESRPSRTRPAAGLDEVLLDVKLSVPRIRPGMVSRAPLIEAARASPARAAGITAPAGYGKSTLMYEWAQTEDRVVGWVSLDRLDDDPGILLAVLASAYVRMFPAWAGLVADVRGVGVSALGRAAPVVASAFRRSPAPFVLMLDDLHELRSPECHDVLGVVMTGIQPGSQLVTASRFEQPHLSRLRASGDMLELQATDLALGPAGAEQIFSMSDVPLTVEHASLVTERTEGWPVGLQLAAMIARDTDQEGWTVSGDDRYVADYLYRESLSQQEQTTQQFLRRTAVLDRLHAPLCDALLGITGSQDQLRTLEAVNSFLIPLDRQRDWFRYHPLFREFLLSELRRVEPDTVMKLHLSAADWYEANGSPVMALEHLLNTSERNRCVQLVTQLTLPTYSVGQLSTVKRWLAALGEGTISSYPPLMVLAGWIAVLAGEPLEAERWADLADDAVYDMALVDGTASFESARSMLRAVMCRSGVAQQRRDADAATAQEPVWSPWRDTALILSAEAHQVAGDIERAAALFAESSRAGAELGNTDTIVYGEASLALLAMDAGRWEEAAEGVARSLSPVQEYLMYDYAPSVLAFAAAARLALHNGAAADLERHLTQAMRARPCCTYAFPTLAVRSRLLMAKVYLARSDPATARHLLREIDDIFRHRPDLGTLVDEVGDFRDLLASGAGSSAAGGPPLTPAELRLLPYLQTHLTIAEIGERLFVSRNTVSSEVASIYRKLGVSSRNEAVERATAVGLLGG
ncbi:LuxR family transcriptional regulator [Nocardioides albus]|uniref:LuxR family maltose regulon positive regulatory protein n=1 Tax=Nocardioides albus TaxID=1841 RepID=A0A7W5A1C8_9ACTN|nr:LuxR family transcriptional regulator [Nocardioides albus]MBB3087862.1 LuxR family maltose regulon positive regulatory protein [Nocardioides albus]GGU20838.1 helix-turn-helix transcriptional regulator [Nocardioides albus]